jgi:hypothetical protein
LATTTLLNDSFKHKGLETPTQTVAVLLPVLWACTRFVVNVATCTTFNKFQIRIHMHCRGKLGRKAFFW